MELQRLLMAHYCIFTNSPGCGVERWSCTGCCCPASFTNSPGCGVERWSYKDCWCPTSFTNSPGWNPEMEQQSLLLPHCLCKLSRLESRDGAAQTIAATLALQFSKLEYRDGTAQTDAVTLAWLILQAGVQRWSCTGWCCHTSMTNSPGWSTEMELHRLMLSH